MAIVFSSKLSPAKGAAATDASAYYTGFALFWSGLTVGMCNLICGVAVGINGSGAALADAADTSLYVPPRGALMSYRVFTSLTMIACSFVKILVVEIFSSVLGLFGLIVGLLVSSQAEAFDSESR